jgi:hypothetical protein
MGDACLDGSVRPKQGYALDYYADRKVPGCAVQPARFQVTSSQEGLALVSKTP